MHPILNCLVLVMSQTIPGAGENQYDVRIQDTTGTGASVVASIAVGGEYISVRNGGNDLPRGFATFVNLKSVRDETGQSVAFEKDSVTRWKLNRKVQRARIEYDVDFVYARGLWPSGNEQAGHWEAGALYTVTKPLFVVGSDDSPSQVSFVLPVGWRVATPWKEMSGSPNSFSVINQASLTDNSIVIGRFSSQKFSAGPFTFTLATFGRTAASAPLMSKVLGAVAKEYVRVFPATPPTSYLMTVFSGSENDGEAFGQSFAFRTGEIPTASNGIMWATTLAHELFHFWNGHMLRGSDGIAAAWLSEGVTEYYANRTLLRTAALPPSAFLSKAENMAGLYVYFRTQPMFDSVTIAQAGSRRTRYRFGVYNGGWAVGFALDREIAQATGGRAGLDDVMRELFRRHSHGTQYSMQDVSAIASNVAGKSMQQFFAKYVDGKELLPMQELFATLGIDADFISYTGEGYFRFASRPTVLQQREWQRYARISAGR